MNNKITIGDYTFQINPEKYVFAFDKSNRKLAFFHPLTYQLYCYLTFSENFEEFSMEGWFNIVIKVNKQTYHID